MNNKIIVRKKYHYVLDIIILIKLIWIVRIMKLYKITLLIIFLANFILPASLFAEDNSINYANYVPKHFLFVVDCSKRMNRKFNLTDSLRKIDLIKDWLPQYINKLPSDIPIGMRIYGHDDGMITFSKCDNSDILAYVGFEKKDRLEDDLEKVASSKETPLGLSLNKAINYDFNNISGLKEIILITDNDGNCKSKPCKLVVKLLRDRNDIKINVIGMKVKSKSTEKDLKCIALSGFGKYYNINNAKELEEALNEILIKNRVTTSPYSQVYK